MRALVRRPGPDLAAGEITHQARVAIDVDLALRQWESYVDALRAASWTIIEVAAADGCPDAVFIEDALVVFDDLAVVARPGAVSRHGEVAGAAAAADELGLERHHIEAPATLDGGDVLKVGRNVFVGVGGRTNRQAVARLQSLLGPRGWTVVAVPVTRVLHLKSAVTALPDGTVIGYPDFVDDASIFSNYREVPEPSGAHVVVLAPDHLLMAADAPRSATLFRSLGHRVTEVDISEFEKMEGCVTCLSVRHRS